MITSATVSRFFVAQWRHLATADKTSLSVHAIQYSPFVIGDPVVRPRRSISLPTSREVSTYVGILIKLTANFINNVLDRPCFASERLLDSYANPLSRISSFVGSSSVKSSINY